MWDLVSGYVTHGDPDSPSAPGLRGAHELTLEERYHRLLLVVEAMWSILKEHGHTDEELRDRIRALDSADGVIDGRRSFPPRKCRSCGSLVEGGRVRCQICGTRTVITNPFEML